MVGPVGTRLTSRKNKGMANTIQDISSDQRIVMSLARFARQPDIMADDAWQKIRVGLRLDMSDSGASLATNTFFFWVGVCSGTASIMGDAGGPSHFIGSRLVPGTRSTAPIKYGTTFIDAQEWVSGSLIQGSLDLESGTTFTGATGTNRTLFFVDFTRNIGGISGNFGVTVFRCNNSSVTDVSQATFDSAVATENAVVSGHAFTSTATLTGVDEEADGVFDHINVNWVLSNPTFRISDLEVVRFA